MERLGKKGFLVMVAAVLVFSLLAKGAETAQATTTQVTATQASATQAPARYIDTSGHWAEASIDRLSSFGILDGFPDGSFRPQETVTADQFVKMLLLSFTDMYPNGDRGWKSAFVNSLSQTNRVILERDHRDFTFRPSTVGYWAKPYIDLAEDLNLLARGQFSDYKTSLNREDVAEIIYYVLKETEYLDDFVYSNSIGSRLGDYQSLSARGQRYVAEVCAKGIMEGYPDGYFGVGMPVTRAESLRILERLMDKDQRIVVTPDDDNFEYIKHVPTLDGTYKLLVFPNEKMMNAYDEMLQAAALRGTNYDVDGTVVRLFRDASAKANAQSVLLTQTNQWDEVSLWMEPGYRIYGVTARLQDGALARNEEAIYKYTAYIFGIYADTFHRFFDGIYSQLAADELVEDHTVIIGDYSVEVRIQDNGGTVVFSILQR